MAIKGGRAAEVKTGPGEDESSAQFVQVWVQQGAA